MSSEQDLISVLEAQGLVTRDQGARLRRCVQSGRSLEEALAATPIIDPLQLLRARQQASTAALDWRPVPLAPIASPPPPVERERPGKSAVDGASRRPASVFAIPTERAAELFRQGGLDEVDLARHEEIPMVRELYALVESAWSSGQMALEFTATEETGGVLRIPRSGRALVGPSEIGPDLAARFIHRLGVLARIATWREGTVHSGGFRFRSSDQRGLAVVELAAAGGRAVVYFLPEEAS